MQDAEVLFLRHLMSQLDEKGYFKGTDDDVLVFDLLCGRLERTV